MKKSLWVPFLTLACSLMFSITAFAGNINSAEQSIITAISGTYEYNGAYYKVTDAYIEKVRNYLSRDDIDMTEAEAQSYISQFNSNISAGVSGGYMEPVDNTGDTDSSSEGNDDSSKNESGNSKDNASGNKNDTGTSNGEGSESSPGNSDGEGTEPSQGNSNGEGTEPSPDNSNGEGGSSSGNSEGGDTTPAGDAITVPSGAAISMDIFNQPETGQESGVVEDNTVGSTIDGEIEYTVFPMDSATMYVWDTDTLDVHAKAYKDSEIIGTLNRGDAVTITGAATTGWAQIDYNGENGYISAVYLRTQSYMSVMEEAEDADDTADSKDYSDAAPLKKSFNFVTIAIVVVIVCIIGSGVIIIWHRNKNRKR